MRFSHALRMLVKKRKFTICLLIIIIVFHLSLFVTVCSHLNLLCNLAESASAKIRHRSLEIIRNMSFNQENRAALLSSDDFLRIVYSILDKNELGDEQLLITVSIWKLIANHAKSKSIIKNSPIFKKLRLLKENLERHTSSTKLKGKSINMAHSINETIEDLEVVLKCVLDILQT